MSAPVFSPGRTLSLRSLTDLGRATWDLQRFGMSREAFTKPPVSHPILLTSVPKAGTHLLETAVCGLPGIHRAPFRTVLPRHIDSSRRLNLMLGLARPGRVLVGHLPYEKRTADSLADREFKTLVMFRHPCAIAVSAVHHILARPDHRMHELMTRTDSLLAQCLLRVEGSDELRIRPLDSQLKAYLQWQSRDSHLVRFEDLVGSAGGGSEASQRECLEGVYRHLGVDSPGRAAERGTTTVFSSSSPTFRNGQQDGWRSELGPRDAATLSAALEETIRAAGYE